MGNELFGRVRGGRSTVIYDPIERPIEFKHGAGLMPQHSLHYLYASPAQLGLPIDRVWSFVKTNYLLDVTC